MPKNDEALQKELGTPKAYNVTPIKEDYPRIISEVKKNSAVEKTISPIADGNFKREMYNEEHGTEENLHDKFVKPNDIEVSPKSFKE